MDFTKNKKNREVQVFTNHYGYVPPQAVSLEKHILGSIMMDPDALSLVSQVLRPEVFYTEANQRVFGAIIRLDKQGVRPRMETVINQLKVTEELDLVGGPYYMTTLTDGVYDGATTIEYNSRVVVQMYIKRKVIEISGIATAAAYQDRNDAFDVLNGLESDLSEVNAYLQGTTSKDYPSLVFNEVNNIIANDGTKPLGIRTRFKGLNDLIICFFAYLHVIAARPAMGKTMFLVNLVEDISNGIYNDNGALEIPGEAVGVIELETSAVSFIHRHISLKTGIDSLRIKMGNLNFFEQEAVKKAGAEIMKQKVYTQFTGMDRDAIRRLIKVWVLRYKVKIVFVDYLQLIDPSEDDEKKTREGQVTAITRDLADLSKDLGVPIIALAQLSRALLNRPNKRPNPGDLRESGFIEQAARCLMFLHRPEYFGEVEDEHGNSTAGLTELIVVKNNDGKTGTVNLKFLPAVSRFVDYDLPLGGYEEIDQDAPF